MAHKSDTSYHLEMIEHKIHSLPQDLRFPESASVVFLHFPYGRTDDDGAKSHTEYKYIASAFEALDEKSTVCILTTPADAARFLPYIQSILNCKLWVAIKLDTCETITSDNRLQGQHAALLALTRYPESLHHTITRIAYTYCPICKKTTKDYGGKKHTYNSYGTMMSDVWRDIAWNPSKEATIIIDRLCDLFAITPYKNLQYYDLRNCYTLQPQTAKAQLTHQQIESYLEKYIRLTSKLVNDDCLNALATIPDNSIDFGFADPPYNLKKKYDSWDDGLEVQKYFEWCDRWLTEMGRILKPNRTLAVINIPLWAVRHYQHLCTVLNFQSWIAWDSLSLPVRMIMPSHYAIICFSKGEPRAPFIPEQNELPMMESCCVRSSCLNMRRKNHINDRTYVSDLWYDIHRLKHNSRRVDHPCQLPPMLMRRLYSIFTKPDEVIIDCFNGAGTSTLVAHQMKRQYIGIELSPEYHKTALKRHDMILQGLDPFGKNTEIPKAKNSRVERLEKIKYKVPKKTLQLDVRRIALLVGHIPSKEEVSQYSKYPMRYFEEYFVSWGEVCAAARNDGMSEVQQKELQLFI